MLLRTLILTIFITSGFFQSSSCQRLLILDAEDHSPIPYATVFLSDGQQQWIGGPSGIVRISPEASDADSLFIEQIGYQRTSIPLASGQNQRVYLQRNVLSLQEVVVSAHRWEQDKSELSRNVQQLDRKQIDLLQASTSADLIGGQGHVYVQKSQLGGGSPMIRGFSTNRVLLVVDGVRMNNAIFRSGNVQNIISLDPAIVENTEILYGPGAVIYGSDAIGGVMDFHTLRPPALVDSGFHLGGYARLRGNTAANERMAHLRIHYGNRSWQAVTAVSRTQWGDLRMGSNGPEAYLRPVYQGRINGKDTLLKNDDPRTQKHTGYHQWNFFQKVGIPLSEKTQLEAVSIFSTTSDIPRYERMIQFRNGIPRSAEWRYGPQKWNLNYLQLTSAAPTRWYDHLKARIAYQWFEESRIDRSWKSDRRRHRTENIAAPSLSVDLDKSWNQLQLYYGLDAQYNYVASNAYEESIVDGRTHPIRSRYPDGSHWSATGVYLSGRYALAENTRLNGGLRADYFSIQAPLDDQIPNFPVQRADLQFFNLSGNLGIVHNIENRARLYATISTGFRAPNIDDIGKVFDSEPGAVVLPNPDLRPEVAQSLDLGADIRLWDRWKIETNLFGTRLSNAMVRRPDQVNGADSILYDGTLSQIQTMQNAAEAYVIGGMITSEVRMGPSILWLLRLNYQKGVSREQDSGGAIQTRPLRHAAPAFGFSSLQFDQKGWQFSLQAHWNGEQPYDRLAPSERNKPHLYIPDERGQLHSPSWYRLDVRVRKRWEQLEIGCSLENITDQAYRPYSSAIAAPGRNLSIDLRYHW